MLKWPGSIQCSLLIKYMLSLNKDTKLDYFNAVLHGKYHGYLFTELGEYQ